MDRDSPHLEPASSRLDPRDGDEMQLDMRPIELDTERRETIEFGGQERRPIPAAVKWLAAIVVLVAVALFYANKSSNSSPPPVSASEAPSGAASIAPPIPDRPSVTNLGYRLLGEGGTWELFGWSSGMMVRIQPSLGRYTITPVPPLASGAPVTLVATPKSALVFSFDNVPAYAVPDGKTAQMVARELHPDGAPLPGPDANHLWIVNAAGSHVSLVTLSGASAGVRLTLPKDADVNGLFADGSGYLLVQTPRGTYDVRPNRTTHVTTGSVLAAGPTGWLVGECDKQQNCVATMVSRSNGARHRVGPYRFQSSAVPGVVSPNGKYAGVIALNGDGSGDVDLIDLTSGHAHPMNISVAGDNVNTMVWSPDSRWLFAADGGLVPIDAANATTVTMDNPWEIVNLAIRP
jgi:hypothetical protein